jgi:hypothetical protein
VEEFVGPLFTNDDRARFVESLWELHEAISDEVTKPVLDPSTLMRLMALAINHCLVGVGTLLMSDPSAGVNGAPGQTEAPFDSVPDLMGHAHREDD